MVRAGRTFVRRLIDLSTTAKRLDHFVRLSTEARSDIEWWWRFCETWNGVRVLLGHPEARVSKVVATDASGSWGCGACWSNHWFRMQWQEETQESHITYKELVPIVLAVTVWGRQWRNATIQVLCDNEAVVAIVNQGTARDKECMHLLRCLAFLKARFNIEIVSTHIAGKTNTLADALSRNAMSRFRMLHVQADPTPTEIPAAVIDVLLVRKPDWTSQGWAEQWSSTFNRD